MTDPAKELYEMSVDELRQTLWMYEKSPLANYIYAFDEMARRLGEQEQLIQETNQLLNACEEGSDLLKQDADKAESALMASQAREAELMGMLLVARGAIASTEEDTFGNTEGYFIRDELIHNIDKALSHSTGSKIGEVVEAHKSGWLVWSNEHEAWWGPNRCGYFLNIESAGRYSLADAIECAETRSPAEVPPEVIVPSPELIRALEAKHE